MQINGYEIQITRNETDPARGQYTAKINGKTVAVCPSKRAALANAKFLAKTMSGAAFAALVV